MIVLKTKPLSSPQGDTDKDSRRMIGGNTTNPNDFNNMKYTWASSWYRQAMNNSWIPEEIGPSTNVKDYQMLSGPERGAFDKILSFLVLLDSIQTANPPCIGQYITTNEVNLCLTIQGFQEAIHSQSYSHMLDSTCNPVEKDRILYQWKEGNHLLQRNTLIRDLYNEFQEKKDDVALPRTMTANYVLEGIYSYSGFMFSYNLGRNGKMPGSVQEVRYTNRDENTHLWLFRNMITELKKEEPGLSTRENVGMMEEMLREGVRQGIQWGCYVIGDEVPGLTKNMVTSYVRYPGNLHWTSFGFESLYPGSEKESESIVWVNQYSNANMVKTDSFEAKSTAYVKSAATTDNLQEVRAVMQDGRRKWQMEVEELEEEWEGREQKGKEQKGKEQKGKEQKGKEQKGKEQKGEEQETGRQKLNQEAWELIRQLVEIDSSDSGAYKGAIEKWIFRWLEQRIGEYAGDLADQIRLEESEVLPGRFNVMARIPGREPGPGLIYICHMDTVTLRDGWSADTPALGAAVKERRLYGRGACDMKSGLVCALTAFSQAVRPGGETGQLLKRPFAFIGTVDEEDFMRGVETVIREGWVYRDGWILDTKPTDGQTQVAHKGRTWFELTMDGITAHVSNPQKGADAIAAMAEAVSSICKSIAGCPSHADLGSSTVTFGQVTGGYCPYVAPDPCKVWIDMRLVSPTNTRAAETIIKQVIDLAQKEAPGVKGHYIITGDRPYMEKNNGSLFLELLRKTCNQATGKNTVVDSLNGYTDTVVIAGILGSHNCMSYRPGSLELAHEPNEFVPYEDVCRCRGVL